MVQHRSRCNEAVMSTLLTFLAGWAEGWIASARPDITVTWEEGPANRDKRATWMAVQGPAAWGQITVWESGEVAVEAMSVDTGKLLFSEHSVVSGVEGLSPLIRKLVATCEA